jgi:hypothetical protein
MVSEQQCTHFRVLVVHREMQSRLYDIDVLSVSKPTTGSEKSHKKGGVERKSSINLLQLIGTTHVIFLQIVDKQ